jgi:hypothetical protein
MEKESFKVVLYFILNNNNIHNMLNNELNILNNILNILNMNQYVKYIKLQITTIKNDTLLRIVKKKD